MDQKVYFNEMNYHVFRGWEQLEVTCNPATHHSNNLWNIEGHENDRGKKPLRTWHGLSGL